METVRTFVTVDNKHKVEIFRDMYAENPRYNTDEPLHCEDWSNKYSIMLKSDKEYKSEDARTFLLYMIEKYGDQKRILETLFENGKQLGKGALEIGCALVYDRQRRAWLLLGNETSYYASKHESGLYEYEYFDLKKDDLDVCEIVESLPDSYIDVLANHYISDAVKMCSYSFSYDGELSFDNEVSCESEGIAYLYKDEFLTYSGCKEDYWNNKTLQEIEFLLDELQAWSEGNVFGYVLSRRVRAIVSTSYPDGEHDDTTEEELQDEEEHSCWGYYGDLDKMEDFILEQCGIKKSDVMSA